MSPTLYLIDGHALAYRTYFALTSSSGGRWTTASGEPTAGVFGFASVLLRLYEHDKPDYLAVAFDTGKTFRDDMFPEYKATRAKMPDDLRPQIERIRHLVDAFNIPRLEMEGYEADDVLGSVAKKAAAEGLSVKIITGDRDLLQLVGERIIVNLPGGKLADAKDYATPEAVKEYFGVRPEQVADYKGLVGDSSDNIPGVRGVGEKTAQSLFEAYPTLDEIYAHLDDLKSAVKSKLAEQKEMAYLSRDLATIRTNLPVKLDLDQAHTDHYDPAVLEALFRDLEFRSLLPRLAALRPKTESTPAPVAAPGPAPVYVQKPGQQLALFDATPATIQVTQPPGKIAVRVADSPESLDELVRTLRAASVISFDTETTSTDEMTAGLVGISLATEAGAGWYVPVGHAAGAQLPLERVADALRGPLTDSRIPKIGHNTKYDYIMLLRHGIRAAPLAFDTMLAQWILDPASRRLGLKDMSEDRLGEEMTHIENLIGKGKNQVSMDLVAIGAAAAYAAADAETTLRLYELLRRDLERAGGMKLLDEIEMPLVPVLADMEMTGVLLDLPFFAQMSNALGRRMLEIETEVHGLVGQRFNINSTQQLSDVLFKTLGLEPPDRTRKTASGHYSTAADVLENLRGKHPVVDLVLEHRELAKLKSTYVDALPPMVDASGRVHTSYSQTGSVTGRLSSNNPNLQNIPTRTELGRRVRNGFIAAPGHVLLSVDYSQVELRIVAHMAGDQSMLDAFRHGQDIHATTAAAIYGIPLVDVNKDMRRHAKAINFGLIYGMSAFGLTRSTELTLAEAEDFVKAYFRQFPGVKRYLDNIRRLATENGYVETLLGRKRYFPALQGTMNPQMRSREEREAINAPIQGTAADIMKIAMIHIPSALAEAGLAARVLLQVHDELVLECPASELEQTARVVRGVMETAYPLSIPLSTEARFGKSWGEMQVLG